MPVAHHPPANLKDFDKGKDPSALFADWDTFITDAVSPARQVPAWYDAASPPVAATPITRAVPAWRGLPRLALTLHQQDVLAAAQAVDAPVPFGGGADALRLSEHPFLDQEGNLIGGVRYRPQDEYLEWVTKRDSDGVVREVWFTCEPPEYWQHIAHRDPDLLVELYRDLMHVDIDPSKLFFATTVSHRPPYEGHPAACYPKCSYNPFNDYNAEAAIHLTHCNNTLGAEIALARQVSLIWNTSPDVNALKLICCGGYGDPNRHSDPIIGKAVNDLARNGYYVTLRDPIGLYIAGIDEAGFTDWDGKRVRNLATDYFVPLRMSDDGSMIVRARFSVPAGVLRNGTQARVGDLSYNGVPIQAGGQIADAITMNLFAQTLPGAPTQLHLMPCTHTCTGDQQSPGVLDLAQIAPGPPSPASAISTPSPFFAPGGGTRLHMR